VSWCRWFPFLCLRKADGAFAVWIYAVYHLMTDESGGSCIKREEELSAEGYRLLISLELANTLNVEVGAIVCMTRTRLP
jgi:hypothetical protein